MGERARLMIEFFNILNEIVMKLVIMIMWLVKCHWLILGFVNFFVIITFTNTMRCRIRNQQSAGVNKHIFCVSLSSGTLPLVLPVWFVVRSSPSRTWRWWPGSWACTWWLWSLASSSTEQSSCPAFTLLSSGKTPLPSSSASSRHGLLLWGQPPG